MLTVFTPTYNRQATLGRLYNSLLEQTSYDFEWLIVDDGSTDTTESVVSEYVDNGKFTVRYIKKENGGKHTAYNMALLLAQGDYFFCVDSDDLLPCDAVASILESASGILPGCGIIAYKQDFNGKLLSDVFPSDVSYIGMTQLSVNHNCRGEFALVFPTVIAKEYAFPVFSGEKFVTESVVYDKLSIDLNMFLLPMVLTICEYQEDGYSNNLNLTMKNNPCGFSLYFMQRIDLMPSVMQKLIHAGKYHCFRSMGGSQAPVYTGKHKIISGLGMPLGILFRLYYKLFRGF